MGDNGDALEILEKRKERKLQRKLLRMQRKEIKKYIPQKSHFDDVTKISYPKESEDLSCKKSPKNKLLNMVVG